MSNILLLFTQGVLRLHIVEARELIRADVGVLGMGKSDPYCIISGMCDVFIYIY